MFQRMLTIQAGSSQHTQGPSCDSQPPVDQRAYWKCRDWCVAQMDRPIKALYRTIVIAICVIRDKVVYVQKAVFPHTWSRGISKKYGPMTLLYPFAFLRYPFPRVCNPCVEFQGSEKEKASSGLDFLVKVLEHWEAVSGFCFLPHTRDNSDVLVKV